MSAITLMSLSLEDMLNLKACINTCDLFKDQIKNVATFLVAGCLLPLVAEMTLPNAAVRTILGMSSVNLKPVAVDLTPKCMNYFFNVLQRSATSVAYLR